MISLNTRGIVNDKKRRAIFDKHRFHADILILQETHSSPDFEKVWESEWGGKIIFSHGSTQSKGVAILVKKDFKSVIENIFTSIDGRIVMVDVREGCQVITIVAIYAPNEDCPQFFTNIASLIKERSEHKIIIGDFNLVLDVELDRENTYSNNNKAMYEVENLCDEFMLKDIWRSRNLDKKEFSWRKGNTFPIKASRIDFALVSAGLDQNVELIQYTSSIFTDHRALYMVVELTQFDRGVGYWKFNTTLLQDKEFITKMNQEIELTLQATVNSLPKKRWETLKTRVCKISKQYARRKASQRNLIISQLSEIVDEIESRLPVSREEYSMLEQTKADLEDKTLEKIQGVMFRSKAKWYEEGEKCTKYFYSLEKSKYNAKTCYKIIDEQGILGKMLKRFYKFKESSTPSYMKWMRMCLLH